MNRNCGSANISSFLRRKSRRFVLPVPASSCEVTPCVLLKHSTTDNEHPLLLTSNPLYNSVRTLC